MKILHIITSTNRGGAENHLLSLAGGQARSRGDDVCVIALSPGPDTLDPFFAAAGVDVRHIELKNKYFPYRCIGSLVREIRSFSPDIVHSHLLPANVVAGIAAKICGIPHIASKHNDESQIKKSIIWRYIHKYTSFLFDDSIICLSSYVLRACLETHLSIMKRFNSMLAMAI